MSRLPECTEKLQLWPGIGGPVVDYISAPPDLKKLSSPRSLCILGSTGSIGVNALEIAAKLSFKIWALAGGSNIRLLAEQAIRFQPQLLAVKDGHHADMLALELKNKCRAEIYWGVEGYKQLAADKGSDLVVCAQMGGIGLAGTLAAALSGKIIALANKESLALGGGLLRKICQVTGSSILPVDSEHYALFQCCSGRGQTPEKFVLTASGGPFLHKSLEELEKVSPEMALKHPNWKMGKKITVDSASLMNKGLELIEAVQLYGLTLDQVSILVHPQSVIHSLVQFNDNSCLAQLAIPNMKLPISACLTWPCNDKPFIEKLDLAKIGQLTFEQPDEARFPCLKLAREACACKPEGQWKIFGLNPAVIVLSSANEAAVGNFLENKCAFTDIPELIAKALQKLVYENAPSAFVTDKANIKQFVEDGYKNILRLEAEAKEYVAETLACLN